MSALWSHKRTTRNVSRHLRDAFPFPYTEVDAQAWLDRNADREPVTNFAIDLDGEAIGSVGLRFSRTSIDAPPRSGTGSARRTGGEASRLTRFGR